MAVPSASRYQASERSRARGWALLGLAGLLALVVLLAFPTAEATHFRYGHFTWTPAGGNAVDFTLQDAFRRNGYGCINPATLGAKACSGADGYALPGDVILEGIGGTSFCYGDLACTGTLYYLVTSVDQANNWLYGLALEPGNTASLDTSIRRNYAAPGNYTAFIQSCCRISGSLAPNAHLNNPDGNYRVETLVNAGGTHSSPVSSLPPIVLCPINGACTFTVPVSDADGDPVKYRLATSSEAGGFTQPGPPQAPNPANITQAGVYEWNTTGAALGPSGHNTLYSTQVIIEDYDPGTALAKSKVALDFFVQLVPKVGVAPVFLAPECGSTVGAVVGQQLQFGVQASDADADQNVTLNAVGLPQGALLSPALPTVGNPVGTTLTWTPSGVSNNVVTFSAVDDTGQQALCSIVLLAVRGAFDAYGSGVTLHGALGDVGPVPFGTAYDPATWAHHGVDVGAARVFGVEFELEGDVDFPSFVTIDAFARAQATAARVEVPGVLLAEGVSVEVESFVDAAGAESISHVRFARLVVGGVQVDLGEDALPQTLVVPGVATVHVHKVAASGDASNANRTATALHVAFAPGLALEDLWLVSASANVGRDVVVVSDQGPIEPESAPPRPLPEPSPPRAAVPAERPQAAAAAPRGERP